MKKTHIFLSLTAASLTAISLLASSQAPAGEYGEIPAEQTELSDIDYAAILAAREDSIALAKAAVALDKATAAYKNLKFIQFDGATEAELYPEAMAVYEAACEAIATPRVEQADLTRLRGMLLDINSLLMQGAVYYSSQGNQSDMAKMAIACVDTRLRPDMASYPFSQSNAQVYPSMVYVAASNAYNSGEFEKALDYLEEYLKTGESTRCEQVSLFLGQACINTHNPERGISYLLEAVDKYPSNHNLLLITLQNLLDAGRTSEMAPLLERALLIKPDDEALLNLQASLCEEEGNFVGALDAYNRLFELHPTNLGVNQHLALCYYNLGVDYYNRALSEPDEKVSKRNLRQSRAYFMSAQDRLETVLANDPSNPKYLKALAMTYASLGETAKLNELNTRLLAAGVSPVKVETMPESVAFADSNAARRRTENAAIPDFQEFARAMVEPELAEWSQRKEFEKPEDFERRVSDANFAKEYERLCKQAESEYLRRYASRIRITDLSLEPYDINNESYLINSAMGPMVVKVPLKNKEAESFKSVWNSVRPQNARYFIDNNRLAVAYVEFVTPSGKIYPYNAEKAADYKFTNVQVNVNEYLAKHQDKNPGASSGPNTPKIEILHAKSDVDQNIPVTSRKNDRTVALIWANEDYKSVSDVAGAHNDGETFAKYCRQTLGIPEHQIILMKDLTYGDMLSSVHKLKQLVGVLGDGVDLIFFYAGHGFPDEASKDAFLLPVDGDGMTTAVSYPLKKLYEDLAGTRADNVMAFLDACFSGGGRDGNALVKARGIALKPQAAEPEGSMFVLTATSGQETAMPYKEKHHGLFTYWLLKKLQESKGNATLQELSDYVSENVKKSSLSVNRKIQTPTVKTSGKMSGEWSRKKLRP